MEENYNELGGEETNVDTKTPIAKIADAAVKTACKQLEEGLKSRAGRFEEIAKSESQYNGEKTKALKGRHNIPFDSVVARGFVDTLHGKIDEGLQLTFDRAPGRQQDKKPAEKITAVCEHESGPDQGAWDMKDLGVKKLAIFSGRGIYKKYSCRENGEFKDVLEVVDHWDFVTEGQGGGFLDSHLYKGQMNIFRSRQDILDNMDYGSYDKKQAYKLFAATSDEQFKKNQDIYKYKVSRAASLGIDFDATQHIGSQLYRLVEWVLLFRGKWYYMVFSYETGIWLRFEPLEDVFSVAKTKKGRGPWVSWATHFDPFVFWSIAPMDSVRPIAIAMKKVINLSLDNLEKRNWGMRAYDPNVFNPRDLLWKENGLVKANIRSGQNINNHIVTFETPDTTAITINMVEYLNAFLGEKTGITPGSQGKSDEDKVGIYVGNIQQVADRLGLTNKMYEQAHVDLAVNFQYGLYDHMPEKYAVKVVGNNGIEWNEELLRPEVNNKFTIRVRGTNTEEKMNIVLTEKKMASLKMIQIDPELRAATNKQWRLRQTLSLGGYDQEEIRVAQDTNSDADDDILAEAAQAIEEIISGKNPKMNRGATTGYIRKIVEYAYDTDLDDKTFNRLKDFANKHIPIAQENAARKVSQLVAAANIASFSNVTPSEGNTAVPAGGETSMISSPVPSPAAPVTA